jgi:Fungal Zn(2)-Cys(6) binuclear cluster domain
MAMNMHWVSLQCETSTASPVSRPVKPGENPRLIDLSKAIESFPDALRECAARYSYVWQCHTWIQDHPNGCIQSFCSANNLPKTLVSLIQSDYYYLNLEGRFGKAIWLSHIKTNSDTSCSPVPTGEILSKIEDRLEKSPAFMGSLKTVSTFFTETLTVYRGMCITAGFGWMADFRMPCLRCSEHGLDCNGNPCTECKSAKCLRYACNLCLQAFRTCSGVDLRLYWNTSFLTLAVASTPDDSAAQQYHKSCDRCRKKKRKCDKKLQCDNCLKESIRCARTLDQRRKRMQQDPARFSSPHNRTSPSSTNFHPLASAPQEDIEFILNLMNGPSQALGEGNWLV